METSRMNAIEAFKYSACALTMLTGVVGFSFWLLLVH